MCGIAGKVSFTNKTVLTSAINHMTEVIKYRGPDDGGVYISPDRKVGLGNRRLAIIDLSPAGHMPMSYLDRYWITYNGEIYNFQSERANLIKFGCHFKSHTDTEVILALYHKYGVKCLDHLRGMFAFAIYDRQKNTLFCARDRLGKKPFKYFHNGQAFIFASELKAILTQPEYHREPDYLAIHHYLTYQYCPAPLTGFIGIKKLEPGHYLFLDIGTNKLVNKRYWLLDFSQKLDLSEDAWSERILSKLEESVKLRLISDVPLGAFLSGGLDSSAVVALMTKNSSRPVKTFSIGFDQDAHNELPYARIIADRFKTDHTEFVVRPETIDILPYLVSQYEEPFADSSGLATYYVSKLTRERVTVALNGDGGDENFAGYPWYPIQKFSLLWENFKFLHPLSRQVWNLAYRVFPQTLTRRGKLFADSFVSDYRRRYVNYRAFFTAAMKSHLYTDRFSHLTKSIDPADYLVDMFSKASADDKLDQTLFTDINTLLPDCFLAKVDIASMANSLEARSPFLDHEFMELTAQMPFSLKLKGWAGSKYLLKHSLTGILPPQIINRPKKGFMLPLKSWFKDDLAKYLESVVLSPQAKRRQLFQSEYISQLITNNTVTGVDFGNQLWSLLTLELWFRAYFD